MNMELPKGFKDLIKHTHLIPTYPSFVTAPGDRLMELAKLTEEMAEALNRLVEDYKTRSIEVHEEEEILNKFKEWK